MAVVVPACDHPQLSVLFVVYGGGALVIDAVASLVQYTNVPFEVIIVDNASEDDSVVQLSTQLRGITLLREEENLGFGQANNHAAKAARAPVLCVLNPDTRVTQGWLEPLLARVAASPVGAVGPALVSELGLLMEAGAVVDHWGMTAPPGRRDFFGAISEPNGPMIVDYLTAACMVIRSDVFRDLGGFDSLYHLAYYEDVDLCYRLWERKFEVWCEPSSRVVHIGGGTADPLAAVELWHRNRSAFLLRWSDELFPRPTFRGSDEDLADLATWRSDHLSTVPVVPKTMMMARFAASLRGVRLPLAARAKLARARWLQ